MNKKIMGILSCFLLGVFIITNQTVSASDGYRYNKVPIKQPELTQSMKPAVKMYNQGNYLGAMQEFQEIVKKDKKNLYAKYYLALCFIQLGYKEDATPCFKDIADADANYALTLYSKMAVACIENPESGECMELSNNASYTSKNAKQDNVAADDEDDITQFINSGKKIHPAAMDKIVNERMQRKLQADLYSLQLQVQEQQPKQETPKRRRRSASAEAAQQ